MKISRPPGPFTVSSHAANRCISAFGSGNASVSSRVWPLTASASGTHCSLIGLQRAENVRFSAGSTTTAPKLIIE